MLQNLQYKMVWPNFALARNVSGSNELRLAKRTRAGMLYSVLAVFLKQSVAV